MIDGPPREHALLLLIDLPIYSEQREKWHTDIHWDKNNKEEKKKIRNRKRNKIGQVFFVDFDEQKQIKIKSQ